MEETLSRSVAILTQYVARPSGAVEFEDLLRSTARDRARLPGAVSVNCLRDRQAPWRFALLEVYEDSAAASARGTAAPVVDWSLQARAFLVQATEERFQVIDEDGAGADR